MKRCDAYDLMQAAERRVVLETRRLEALDRYRVTGHDIWQRVDQRLIGKDGVTALNMNEVDAWALTRLLLVAHKLEMAALELPTERVTHKGDVDVNAPGLLDILATALDGADHKEVDGPA